jgi:endo-1,4-beta-D-glucanase Y
VTHPLPVAAVALAALLGTTACLPPRRAPLEIPDFVAGAWPAYTRAYLHEDGYVLDRTRGRGEVTSEGQSYAMLRAVWMDDPATFARVFAWTERALTRPDGLYSWRWSPRDGGRVLDANSATDGDQDAAFAMVLAGARFGVPRYLTRAASLVRAIRAHTRVDVARGWFPAAGNWAVAERIVNLSYFTPYAYPYFARVDPDGGWLDVLAAGYDLLERSTRGAAAQLPADFMTVDQSGNIGDLPPASTLSRRFSFDAVRIPWRVELDCRLHARERACAAAGGVPALSSLLAPPALRLVTAYDTRGKALSTQESPTFYAAVLPAIDRTRPDVGALLRRDRLSPGALAALQRRNDRYYDANWVWFGLALADGWIVPRTPAVDTIQVATAPN